MQKRIAIYLWFIFGLVLGTSSLALAEDDQLSAGLLFGTSSSVYKGADSEVDLMPMISFRSGRFFIDGVSAGFSLLESETFELDIFAEYGGGGYKASDSNYLVGMKRRKSSIDAGVSASYMSDFGMFNLILKSDVSSIHDGQEVSFSYGVPLYESDGLAVMSSVGVSWQSGRLVDYYYGVSTAEARSGRPAYKADGTVNTFAGIDFSYHLWEQWEMMLSLQGQYLGEEIRNSPLVDKDYEASAMIGVIYHFW